jgi:hypothetical protein
MVPSGYWTKTQISSVDKTWNGKHKSAQKAEAEINEELHLAQILPADYKPVDNAEVVQKKSLLHPKNMNNYYRLSVTLNHYFKGNK